MVTRYRSSHVFIVITIKSDNVSNEARAITLRSDNDFNEPRAITLKSGNFLQCWNILRCYRNNVVTVIQYWRPFLHIRVHIGRVYLILVTPNMPPSAACVQKRRRDALTVQSETRVGIQRHFVGAEILGFGSKTGSCTKPNQIRIHKQLSSRIWGDWQIFKSCHTAHDWSLHYFFLDQSHLAENIRTSSFNQTKSVVLKHNRWFIDVGVGV